MRVLVVTNDYPTPALPHRGVFVKEQVESLRAIGIDVRVLHLDRASGGRGVYRALPRLLREALEAHKPDLAHAMYGGVMADLVARVLVETPLVISFCGNDLFGEGAANLPRRLTGRFGVVCSRRAARRARAIVVKSRGLLTALPGDVDRGSVWLVPNGVDLDLFKPVDAAACRATLGWAQDRRHVLFPADPNRTEKRFPLAAAAVENLRDAGVQVEMHVLSGVAREEVPRWFNASDAILLTSTHEGSPNVVKEALACNVAVVSVDIGDVRERIAGVEGCFLADATSDDLAAKLERALESARVDSRRVVEELSQRRIAERLRSIYAEALTPA
jgi:glycosyltransferase involved in cell wall biosynthesis